MSNSTVATESPEAFSQELTLTFVGVLLVFAWNVVQFYEWFHEKFGKDRAADKLEDITYSQRKEAYDRIEQLHQWINSWSTSRRNQVTTLSSDEYQLLHDLHQWHQREDDSGRKLWYFPESVRQHIHEILEHIRSQNLLRLWERERIRRPRRNSSPPEPV